MVNRKMKKSFPQNGPKSQKGSVWGRVFIFPILAAFARKTGTFSQMDGQFCPCILCLSMILWQGFFADFPCDPFSVLTSLPSRSRTLGAAAMAAEAVLDLRGSCFMPPECVLLDPGPAPPYGPAEIARRLSTFFLFHPSGQPHSDYIFPFIGLYCLYYLSGYIGGDRPWRQTED